MRRISHTLAALLLSLAGAVVTALPAQAVSQCTRFGIIGTPRLYNVGPRNPNTVRNNPPAQNYIYIGASELYCPSGIYVHSGYDIRVDCSNGLYYWKTAYGWNDFGDTCKYLGGSTWAKLNEYKQ